MTDVSDSHILKQQEPSINLKIQLTKMNYLEILKERLITIPTMASGRKRLIILLSQLGDFDSLEYAQALAKQMPQLEDSQINVLAIGIGNSFGADRFCGFTGFPRESLIVDSDPSFHRKLGLYAGLEIFGGAWPGLILMCAGFGSPGTLAEVFRGYKGDHNAPQCIEDNETINVPPFPSISGSLFSRFGVNHQRPFELATVRLRNMREVLTNWRTYIPTDKYICQRGGTFLLGTDDSLLYSYRDQGILGYSETMNQPLSFLKPYLIDENIQTAEEILSQ